MVIHCVPAHKSRNHSITISPNSATTEPALAESCTPNADTTVYVCTLRQGVKFHDGTGFDANDIVETFAMGLDISSPYHKGNANSWDYYNSIFGLMDTSVYTTFLPLITR